MKFLIIIFSLCFSLKANAVNFNNIPLQDMYGQKVKLEDYKTPFRNGFVVNVWSTKCLPCVKEMPSLLRLQQLFPNITVAAISIDKNVNIVNKFLRRNKLPKNVIANFIAPKATGLENLNVKNLPVTFIVDNNGNILERFDGFHNWANEFNYTKIQQKLNF